MYACANCLDELRTMRALTGSPFISLAALQTANQSLSTFNPEFERAHANLGTTLEKNNQHSFHVHMVHLINSSLCIAERRYEVHTQRVQNLRQEIVDLFARMRKLKRTLDDKAKADATASDK